MAVGIPDFPTGLDTEVNLVEATNNAQLTLIVYARYRGHERLVLHQLPVSQTRASLRLMTKLIAYTSKTSTQFTVQTSNGRGYESTVDAQHSSGARVEAGHYGLQQ
jgi:hypothetical protein